MVLSASLSYREASLISRKPVNVQSFNLVQFKPPFPYVFLEWLHCVPSSGKTCRAEGGSFRVLFLELLDLELADVQ